MVFSGLLCKMGTAVLSWALRVLLVVFVWPWCYFCYLKCSFTISFEIPISCIKKIGYWMHKVINWVRKFCICYQIINSFWLCTSWLLCNNWSGLICEICNLLFVYLFQSYMANLGWLQLFRGLITFLTFFYLWYGVDVCSWYISFGIETAQWT